MNRGPVIFKNVSRDTPERNAKRGGRDSGLAKRARSHLVTAHNGHTL